MSLGHNTNQKLFEACRQIIEQVYINTWNRVLLSLAIERSNGLYQT